MTNALKLLIYLSCTNPPLLMFCRLLERYKHDKCLKNLTNSQQILAEVRRVFHDMTGRVLSRIIKFSFPDSRKVFSKYGTFYTGLVKRPRVCMKLVLMQWKQNHGVSIIKFLISYMLNCILIKLIYIYFISFLNSLWLSDTIWRHHLRQHWFR